MYSCIKWEGNLRFYSSGKYPASMQNNSLCVHFSTAPVHCMCMPYGNVYMHNCVIATNSNVCNYIIAMRKTNTPGRRAPLRYRNLKRLSYTATICWCTGDRRLNTLHVPNTIPTSSRAKILFMEFKCRLNKVPPMALDNSLNQGCSAWRTCPQT